MIVLLTLVSQTIGLAATAVGMTFPSGYYVVFFGQATMGVGNILSWTLPSPTSAIWFAQEEVPIAVALQVVARGIGESFGALIPTVLTHEKMTTLEVSLFFKKVSL